MRVNGTRPKHDLGIETNSKMTIDNIEKDLLENMNNMQNKGVFVLAKFYPLMLAPPPFVPKPGMYSQHSAQPAKSEVMYVRNLLFSAS